MEDVLCPHCKNKLSVEEPLNGTQAIMKCNHCNKSYKITFDKATFPVESKSFNWGAFVFTWLWCFFNGQKKYGWVFLVLELIPFVHIIIRIYLGKKGNELAWNGKKWESVSHFNDIQISWTAAGLTAIISIVIIPIAIMLMIQSY